MTRLNRSVCSRVQFSMMGYLSQIALVRCSRHLPDESQPFYLFWQLLVLTCRHIACYFGSALWVLVLCLLCSMSGCGNRIWYFLLPQHSTRMYRHTSCRVLTLFTSTLELWRILTNAFQSHHVFLHSRTLNQCVFSWISLFLPSWLHVQSCRRVLFLARLHAPGWCCLIILGFLASIAVWSLFLMSSKLRAYRIRYRK